VLVYFTEAGDKNEEAIYYKKSYSFKAQTLKAAFTTFASKIRAEIALMPLREFALIGNRRLLLTTSIFDDFFEKPIAKGENLNDQTPFKYSGDEFKDDRISRLFIGFGFQKFLLDWPEKTLDQDFEGYQVLQLIGKEGTWTKVGPSYEKASKVFEEKSSQDQAFVILTHTNGKWYKVSGNKNTNSLYLDAYLGLSGYLQAQKAMVGPMTSELKAGFRMKWQVEEENKAKFEKLKTFYKGDGADKLYKQYTFYALSYDKRSHAVARLNWSSYYYMKKGVEDVAQALYDNVIKQNKEMAYMALCRETGPLYCSEGDMAKKHICQRLIGYAIFNKWLYADEKMIDIKLSTSDRERYHYVAYLGNSDKQDEAVTKPLSWDYAIASRNYQNFFTGKDAGFDYGVIGHTGLRGWWQAKTLYKGAQANMDVYRLIATHAQTKHDLYKKEAKNEEELKLVTKKAHEKKLTDQLDKLNKIYIGKGEALFRRATFFVVTYDRRTDAVARPVNIGSASVKTAVQQMNKYAFDNIVKKDLNIAYLYGVKDASQGEGGDVFHCSEGDLTDSLCRAMIGKAVTADWMVAPKEWINKYMPPSSPDYKYYAVVQNTLNEDGKGPGEPAIVNLTFDLQGSLATYRSLLKPIDGKQKYNIGIVGHYAIQKFYEPKTAITGSGATTDVWEMLAAAAQKAFKAVEAVPKDGMNEEALGLVTTEAAEAKKQGIIKKLRALYQGKAPTLYKNYRFAGYKFDKKKRTFASIGAVNTNSMKAGLTQLVNRINTQIIKPLAEASYVLFIGQTVPFYCSEGKLTDPACRQLIGKAIYDGQLKFDDV
jgi:hypothetical protein